ncbi:DUF262 domain-containing protein [Streptomyces sp. NPDC050844]|uniref:DUF262 domain-containing protein n=1 Tax=Streptomyces sp. NPDC050844 TaxID=3155790 RepID=UPI0033CC5CD2
MLQVQGDDEQVFRRGHERLPSKTSTKVRAHQPGPRPRPAWRQGNSQHQYRPARAAEALLARRRELLPTTSEQRVLAVLDPRAASSACSSSGCDFRIPNYQRPYAWQVEHVEQLLDDLAETLETGGDEPYFLGAIVLVKGPQDAQAEVIDGQQRLTTLTILLAVLRNLAGDPDLAREISNTVVEPGSITLGLAPKARLTLRSKDADFFRSNVQTSGAINDLLDRKPATFKTDAQCAIQSNAGALLEKLAPWPEQRRVELAQMLLKQRATLPAKPVPPRRTGRTLGERTCPAREFEEGASGQ